MSETLDVAISWWSPSEPPGGSSQAIRGNVKAFVDAGHDVELYWHDQMALLESRADRYDLVLVPYLWANQYRDLEAYRDTHLHLQIGGYGNPENDHRLMTRVLEAADSVSVLDVGPAQFYDEVDGMVLDDVAVIPNAPNADLFEPQPADATEGFVFTPKTGAYHKTGRLLAYTASRLPMTTFEAHLKRPQDFNRATGAQKPANVHLKPPVPFPAMGTRYREALMVFNAAERETLPNVCYEAMLSERAYVGYREAAAKLQTVPDLDADDFGLSAADWLDEYRADVYAGDHLWLVSRQDQLPRAVEALLQDDAERRRVATAGREWIENALGDYTWERKAELIVECMDGG